MGEVLREDQEYDPDASSANLTHCPGCGEEILVFPGGTIAQRRDEPHPPGEIPASLMDSAFRPHYCDANDREWVCHHCKTRYDEEDMARYCCGGYVDSGYSLVADYPPEGDGEGDDV